MHSPDELFSTGLSGRRTDIIVVAVHAGASPPAGELTSAGGTPRGRPALTADEAARCIVAIAERQDRTAFAALYRHYVPRLTGAFASNGAELSVAQEVAQEAMIMVWRKAATFDPMRASVATWIFAIARNKFRDHFRRAARPAISIDDWMTVFAPPEHGADRATIANQAYGQVKELLGTLSEDQQVVLRMAFFEDKPHAAIADELGLPLSTVKITRAIGAPPFASWLGERVVSRHLAPKELLLDYAAGTLLDGPALAVAAHVSLSSDAKDAVRCFAATRDALLEDMQCAPVDDHELAEALKQLDHTPVEGTASTRMPSCGPPPGFEWLPTSLNRRLPVRPRWSYVLGGFERLRIPTLDGTHCIQLLKLTPGRGLPLHRHSGNEYTVVLQGGFTDITGHYVAGDFAVGSGARDHQPVADPGVPCIALNVVEGPIVLAGPWGRLLNPFVKRGWL